MKGDGIAFGVNQRPAGSLDVGQKRLERLAIAARHAQARDMDDNVLREVADHLLLDHAVR